MKKSEQFIKYFGLNKSIVGLLIMVVLVGMGERMSERFLPIYLMALGGGAISIGLLNGLDNFLSAIYSLLGGYISDRFGVKKSLLFFNLLAMAGFLVVIAFPYWQAVIAGSVLFLSWTAISLPATMSLVSAVLPKNKRTMGVSVHSLVRRVPMALGPVMGGIFIGIWGEVMGIRVAFLGAFLLAAIASVAQQIMIQDDFKEKEERFYLRDFFRLFHELGAPLKRLLISDILIRFCEQIPYAFVVVWAMKIISQPVTAVQFGLLTTIEMITAILIYIPVAHYADKTHKKPFVVATFFFFTLFPLALMFCQSFYLLIPVFILRGLKEFGEPTRKALIMDLAPENKKAVSFGLYYLCRDIIVSGSAFAGAFLWIKSPYVNLSVAFIFGLAGTLWFIFFGSDLDKK